MPKSTGGGGGSNLFTTNITGPAPGPLTAGSNEWIDLGVIPTGKRIWFGNMQIASVDKTMAFEIRTSNIGQSAGSDAATSLLASKSVSPRSGTVMADFYNKGRLHIVSVVGTGIEKFWIRLKAKSGAAGSYYYSLNYTTE